MSRLTRDQIEFITGTGFSPEEYRRKFPGDKRSFEALYRARRRYGPVEQRIYPVDGSAPMLQQRETDPAVFWDKKASTVNWRDWIQPLRDLQELHKASSGSQDTATIHVRSKKPVPVLFISDWHAGSWGTSYRKVAQVTRKIEELGLRVAVLGDMLQMSIRLRGILEISDNALTPRDQIYWLRSWLEEFGQFVLWSTWDNHSVEREEDATGFSYVAELFKESTIYHSGIGHVDLTVGSGDVTETYKICSSHRFRGNTQANPVNGTVKYMRLHGIDRELGVAGDSHSVALYRYADGPLPRLAINCGSLQGDSGYGKRHFSPYSHDWMPVVVFHPDTHLMTSYESLEAYERRCN